MELCTMTMPTAIRNDQGVVMVHPTREHEPEHERITHRELARKIAAMQGRTLADQCDPFTLVSGGVYYVPTDTIVGIEHAQALGILGENDLFGGVVPYPFVATKAITHSLVSPEAYAPKGWSREFSMRVHDSVLVGVTAFTLDDARTAGLRLLEKGLIRIKPVRSRAGRGQIVVANATELACALEQQDASEVDTFGLVLEEHLEEVNTYSVGQVRITHLVGTYFGTQRLTKDNNGEIVYGGSDLVVARGGFDALLRLDLPEGARDAVTKAQIYDHAADHCFPGFFASRRNYDIAKGLDTSGARRSGVLEQSWRIGGASSAEIVALEVFHSNAGTQAVRASSHEVFGLEHSPPADAIVFFNGEDREIGHMMKYAIVGSYGNT